MDLDSYKERYSSSHDSANDVFQELCAMVEAVNVSIHRRLCSFDSSC